MTSRRVVVTGMGALTPIGNDLESYWNGLISGTSGCANITHFDASNFKTNIIASKEPFYVKVQICSKSFIENPIYALTIRNTKGQNIYGQNHINAANQHKNR